jgi:spore maturation protein CgeB
MGPNARKPRILFEAPLHVPHIGVETFCCNALTGLGCKVERFEFWKPLRSARTPAGGRAAAAGASASGKVSGKRIPLYPWLKKTINEIRLRSAVRAFRPDLLFVLGGKWVPPEIIDRTRRRFHLKTACWSIDDPQLIDHSLRFAHVYDHFFTDDPFSVGIYKRFGIHATAIAFGCDPLYHRSVPLSPEDRRRFGSNLVFNGTLYPDRIRLLETVADLGLSIWGLDSKTIRTNRLLWPCYRGDCSIEELVKIYNASKILINPHLDFGRPVEKRGTWANLRLFEAAGSGVFQLVDRKPVVEQCFKEGTEMILFDRPEELRKLAIQYLADESARSSIARAAQARAHRDHTFADRMRELLKTAMP